MQTDAKPNSRGFLAELAYFVARGFRLEQGVVDQAGETRIEFHHRWAAGNAVGAGVHNGPGLSRAFLGAVLVAIGANFVVALRSQRDGKLRGPAKVSHELLR